MLMPLQSWSAVLVTISSN